MRDWRKFVQVQLAGLPLSPGTKADVVDELAGHLEEVYGRPPAPGHDRGTGRTACNGQVTDWNALERHIRNAKER
jgi:hypothetical protein